MKRTLSLSHTVSEEVVSLVVVLIIYQRCMLYQRLFFVSSGDTPKLRVIDSGRTSDTRFATPNLHLNSTNDIPRRDVSLII